MGAGLSVPDSDLLLTLSEALETPVSTLLGETVTESKTDDLKATCEKLEIINLQLAQRKESRRKTLHWIFILLCALTAAIFLLLAAFNSPYLVGNHSDPETAVLGTAFHACELIYIRCAPFLLIGSIVGIVLTRKKHELLMLFSFCPNIFSTPSMHPRAAAAGLASFAAAATSTTGAMGLFSVEQQSGEEAQDDQRNETIIQYGHSSIPPI